MSDIERTLLIRIKNILEGSGASAAKTELDRLITGAKEHADAAKQQKTGVDQVRESVMKLGGAFRAGAGATRGSIEGIGMAIRMLIAGPLYLLGLAAGTAVGLIVSHFARAKAATEDAQKKAAETKQAYDALNQVRLDDLAAQADAIAAAYTRAITKANELRLALADVREEQQRVREEADQFYRSEDPNALMSIAREKRDQAIADLDQRETEIKDEVAQRLGEKDQAEAEMEKIRQPAFGAKSVFALRVNEAVRLGYTTEARANDPKLLDADLAEAEQALQEAQATAARPAMPWEGRTATSDREMVTKAQSRATAMRSLKATRLQRDEAMEMYARLSPAAQTRIDAAQGRVDALQIEQAGIDPKRQSIMTAYDKEMRRIGEMAPPETPVPLGVLAQQLTERLQGGGTPDQRNAVIAALNELARGGELSDVWSRMLESLQKTNGRFSTTREEVLKRLREIDGRLDAMELKAKASR